MYAPNGIVGSNLPSMNLTIMNDLEIVPVEKNKYENYLGVMRTIHLNNKIYKVWYYISHEHILSEVKATRCVNGKLTKERVTVKEVINDPSILLNDHEFQKNLKNTIVKMKNFACGYGLGNNDEFRSLALIGDEIKFRYFDEETSTFTDKAKPILPSLNEELKRPGLDEKMKNLFKILKEDVLEKKMEAAQRNQKSTSIKPEAEIEYIRNVRDHTYETKVFSRLPDPETDPLLDGFKVVDANPLTDQVEKELVELEAGIVTPKKEVGFWQRLKFLITGDEAVIAQKKFRERQEARDNAAKAEAPAREERRIPEAPARESRVLPVVELKVEEKAEEDALHRPKLRPVKEAARDSMPDVVPREFLKEKESDEESEKEEVKLRIPSPSPPPKKDDEGAPKAEKDMPAVVNPPPPPPPPGKKDNADAFGVGEPASSEPDLDKPAVKPAPPSNKPVAKPAPQPKKGAAKPQAPDLLDQIKAGKKLKPIPKQTESEENGEKAKEVPAPKKGDSSLTDNLQSSNVLAKALKSRREAIAGPDNSPSSSK